MFSNDVWYFTVEQMGQNIALYVSGLEGDVDSRDGKQISIIIKLTVVRS